MSDVLKPIDISTFSWRVTPVESYLVVNDELDIDKDLFETDNEIMEGADLKNLLENNVYYIIFADLQAYPKGKVSEIETYEEFVESECELVLFVVDSCYTVIYCKDKENSNYFIRTQQSSDLKIYNLLLMKMIQEQE